MHPGFGFTLYLQMSFLFFCFLIETLEVFSMLPNERT